MRSPLLILGLLLLDAHAPAHAQLMAGEVPAGMSALDLNLGIALTDAFTADSAAVEFDCDDSFDAWAVLYRNAPEVDAPNYAMLRFVDTDIEVCVDLATGWQQRPRYHAFGELLDCAGNFNWQNVGQVVLGDFGGFTAIGPIAIEDQYIAYRRGTQTGWMLLSIDVQGGLDNVSMQVQQLLPLCPGPMTVSDTASTSGITLFPNPSGGEPIQVRCMDALRSIEVLDASGRSIAQYSGAVRTLAAPEAAGTYLIRAIRMDGSRTITRVVSY